MSGLAGQNLILRFVEALIHGGGGKRGRFSKELLFTQPPTLQGRLRLRDSELYLFMHSIHCPKKLVPRTDSEGVAACGVRNVAVQGSSVEVAMP